MLQDAVYLDRIAERLAPCRVRLATKTPDYRWVILNVAEIEALQYRGEICSVVMRSGERYAIASHIMGSLIEIVSKQGAYYDLTPDL